MPNNYGRNRWAAVPSMMRKSWRSLRGRLTPLNLSDTSSEVVQAPTSLNKRLRTECQVVYRPPREKTKKRQAGDRQQPRPTDDVQERRKPTITRSRDVSRIYDPVKVFTPPRNTVFNNRQCIQRHRNFDKQPCRCRRIGRVWFGWHYVDELYTVLECLFEQYP